MKTFARWNNPAKFFCQNIVGSEDFADQRIYTQNANREFTDQNLKMQ